LSYSAVAPSRRVEPEEVGADTWLIHSAQDALGQPLVVYLNAMVIKAEEPVIVDTNTIANRKQWLDDVFGRHERLARGVRAAVDAWWTGLRRVAIAIACLLIAVPGWRSQRASASLKGLLP